MATRTTIKSYTTNLAKSLGYITFDTLVKDTSLHETVSENKEVVKDLYQGIKDFAKSPRDALKNSPVLSEYSPILKDGFKNLMEDIKTGTIYNKEREDSVWMSSVTGDDYDTDFDFDFSGEDAFDFEGGNEESTVDSSTMAAKAQSIAAGQNIKAMDIVGKTTAKAINTTTARSAQYIVQAQQASTALIMKQQAKMFNQVSVGLAGVNQNLGTLVSLGEPLTAHMQNSMKFYTETSQKLDKMTNLLENINKSLMPAQASGSKTSYKGLDSYLTSGGAINLAGMKQMLTRNLKTQIDSSGLGMMLNMQMGSDGKDMWRAMAANPLGTILTFALPSMLPKSFKDSIEHLGKSLSGFNVALIKKLGNMKGNPVKEFIAGLFGYDDTLKTSMDTSKYNKGKVDFDGKTRKAIIEVIPTYLSKILAALTGGFETRYDYEKGRFMNRQQIMAANRGVVKDAARNIGYDFTDYDDIQKAFKGKNNGQGLTSEEAVKVQAKVEKYLENAIRTNTLLDPNKKVTNDDARKLGFKNKEELQDVIDLYNYYMATNNWYKIQELNLNINRQRLAISERMGGMSSDDILVNAANFGFDNSVFGGARMAVGAGGNYAQMSKYTQAVNDRYANKVKPVKLITEGEFKSKIKNVKRQKDKDELTEEFYLLKDLGNAASPTKIKAFMDKLNESMRSNRSSTDSVSETISGFKSKVQRIIESPLSLVTDIISKADKTLFEIIYGKVDSSGKVKEDEKHESVLGLMFTNMKDMFTTFKDWMRDHIFNPIRKFLDDRGGIKGIIGDFLGIDLDVAWQNGKAKARDLARRVGNNFKSVGQWSWNQLKTLPGEFGFGSGSGLVSARQYYGGSAFGNYDENVVVSAFKDIKAGMSLTEAAKKYGIKPGDLNRIIQKNPTLNSLMDTIHRGAVGARQSRTAQRLKNAKENVVSSFTNEEGLGYRTVQAGSDAIHRIISELTPNGKDLSETEKKAKDVIKNALSSLKLDASGAVTGALMGGGLSILSGGILSPMIAASIGAAAGLVIKSDNVQDALFGPMDPKTKERDGSGLLTKEMTDFLTKKLPSVAGFSLAGGIAGLLPIVPGGPIGGLFIGAGIGFAKKSQMVQEFLYGDSEAGTTGILGSQDDKQKRIEFIKRMAPKAILGAALGAVAGPFGFVGNIMGGAALGFASETKIFQETMFGKEEPLLGDDGKPVMENGKPVMVRSGGIFGWLRKGIINPLADAIKPIASELKFNAKKMIRGLGRIIGNVFRDHIGKPLWATAKHYLAPLWRVVSKPIKWIGNIVAAPFKAIGRYGTHLKNKQVRQGRAEYMSAVDRLNYRLTSDYGGGEDDFVGFDTALSKMDESQLATMRANILGASKLKNKTIRVANQKLQAIIDRFYGISWAAGQVAYKMLKDPKKGNTPTDVFIALENRRNPINVSDEDKQIINEMFVEYEKSKLNSEENIGTFQDYLADLKDKLHLDKDVKVNEKNFQQYLDMIKAEENFRRKGVQKTDLNEGAVRNELIKAHTQITAAKLNNIINKLAVIGNAIIPGSPFSLRSGGTADYDRNLTDIRSTDAWDEDETANRMIEEAQQRNQEMLDGSDYDFYSGEGSGLMSARRWYRRFRGRGVGEDVGGESVDSLTGESLSYTKTDSGEFIQDIGDVGNRKAERKRQAFFGKFDRIGDGVHAINDTLKGLKDKLFGNKEKQEPGLFEKLKNGVSNLLFGDNGFLGGIFGFLTGKSMGGLVGKLLSKFSLKAALPWIGSALGLSAFSAAVSGKLDGIFNKLGWSNPKTTEMATGKNGETLAKARKATADDAKKAAEQGYTIQEGDLVYTDGSGNVVPVTASVNGQMPKEGDFVNASTGQVYRDEVEITSGGSQTMSNLAIKSIVHSGVTGHGTAAFLAKKVVKTVSESKVGKAVAKFAADHFDDIALSVYTHVDDIIIKLAEKFPNLIPKKLALKSRSIAAELAEKVMKRSGAAAAKTGARTAGKAFIIAEIVIVAADFMSGYEDARTTLGIVDEPTIPQRLLSGLFRAVKNFVPFLDLIPDSVIIDVFCNYIAPIFGIDIGELKDQRARAKETVEAYNNSAYAQEHGISLSSVEDYNKQVLHDYTITERIGNAAKETFYDVRNSARNYADKVKEQGFWKGTGQAVKDFATSFASDLSSEGLGIALANKLPGIYGDIVRAREEVSKYAAAGDLKGMWQVEVAGFDGGGKDTNGDGVEEVSAGIFSRAIGQIPLLVRKLIGTPIALVVKLFQKLNLGALFDKVKLGFGHLTEGIAQQNEFIREGDVSGLIASTQPEDAENPVGGFLNGVYNVTKFVGVIPASISFVGHKVKAVFDKITNTAKSSVMSIAQTTRDMQAITATGDYQKVWDYNPASTVDPDNPIGGLIHGINVVQKLFGFPQALMANIGKAIRKKFEEITAVAKSSIGSVNQNSADIMGFIGAGDVEGLWNYEPSDNVDENNPIGGFVKGITHVQKFFGFAPAAVSWVAHKVKAKFDEILGVAKSSFGSLDQTQVDINAFALAGDLKGLNEYDPKGYIEEDNPIGGLVGGINSIQKVVAYPTTAISWVGHKVFGAIKDKIDKVKANATNLTDGFDKMSEAAKEGHVGEVWDIKTEFNSGAITDGIFNVVSGIGKVLYTVVALAYKLIGPLEKAAGYVKEKVEDVKDWVGDKKDKVVNKVTDVKNTVKEGVSNTWNKAKNAVMDSGVGHLLYGADYESGSGSFISQMNPRIAGKRFGSSTFGQNGCAPAVASMLTGMPVGSTAGYALGGGYTNASGTSADYFGNIFAQNGIPSEYVFTGGGSAQDYLESRIASGHPTVLLGQDYSNTSKAYSPFGPGNHYVLATGEDSHGNLIIQDPEASRPNITYNRSILNSVKLGIPTGGSSRISRATRARRGNIKRAFMFRGGASFEISDNHKQIWTFLKKNGLSDAGAAGLMGCWQAESGNRPDRIEGDYVKSFPGFAAVASSSDAMDQWTLKLFSMYANKGIKINQGAYKAEDGHYYPGYGLAQWTGPRGYKLLSWCRQKDYDWKQLLPQLEYALSELQSKYSGVYNDLKNANDVNEACRAAYNKYEGGKRQDWLQTRQNYAIAIYNALSGKTYSMPTSTGTAADNVYGTVQNAEGGPISGAAVGAETGSSSASDKIGTLGSLFGKMFSAAMGGLGKLLGFGDYDDESTGATGGIGSSGSAYDYSGNVITPDGTQSTSLKPLPDLNSSHAINFVNAALSQKGYVETPNNMTDFGAFTGVNGQPWCASFVSWAMNKAFKGNAANAAKVMYGGPTAAVQTLWDRFRNNDAMSSTPAVGDIVIYKNGTSHTGIVSKVDGNNIETVEGNTSGDASFSRNGGMVWTKSFDYTKKGNLTGFGRPNWAAVHEDATQMGADDSRTSGSVGLNLSAGLNAGRQRAGIATTSMGTTNYGEYMQAMHGGGSGLYNVAQAGYNTINRQHRHARSVFGSGSGVVNLSKLSEASRARYISALQQYAGGGAIGNEAMMTLIKGIISLLSNVSANSDQIKEAVVVLNKILEVSSGNTGGDMNLNVSTAASDMEVDDTDRTIREMQQLLNNLAMGA